MNGKSRKHGILRLFNNHPILLIIMVGVAVLVWCMFFNRNTWWEISTGSTISLPLTYNGKTLYVGNISGNILAIDTRTGKTLWSAAPSDSTDSPLLYDRGALYVTSSDGILCSFDANTGKERWRFVLDNGYVFATPPQIKSNYLYIGDSTGTLYALRLGTGTVAWKFSLLPVKSDALDRSNWFGQFEFLGDKIIVAGRDGIVYSLYLKTGKMAWKHVMDSAISALESNNGTIFAASKNGQVIALTQDGREQWKSTGNKKVTYFSFLYKDSPITRLLSILPSRLVPEFFIRRYFSIIEINTAGDISLRDLRTGKKFYTSPFGVDSKNNSNITTPPTVWSQYLFFGEANGDIVKFDVPKGTEVWKYSTNETISARPVVAYRNTVLRGFCSKFGSFAVASHVCLATVFVGNYDGILYAVRANSGKFIWDFHTFGPIVSPAKIIDGNIYQDNSGGNVYKIRLNNGEIPKMAGWKNLTVKQNSSVVSGNGILEITMIYPDNYYPHPWEDLSVSSVFTNSSGKAVTVYGYYFDKNVWKIKFNPTEKGEWKYRIRFQLPDKALVRTGSFRSTKSNKDSYLKEFHDDKNVFTLDGHTEFPIVGIQDVIDDANCNGNLIDDFYIGGTEQDTLPDMYVKNCQGSHTHVFNDYLSEYGDRGRIFNTYRWNIDNSSFNLVNLVQNMDPISYKYSTFNGKLGDTIAQSVANHGLQLWMTMFSWNIPNESLWQFSPIYSYLAKQYIKYVVARYGAYVSVWELDNEAHTKDSIIDSLAKYIKSIDYVPRLVSMSWERPSLSSIDITSLHWYENENLGDSDARVLQVIKKYLGFNKPIVFSEQGNKSANWDEYSAIRMRVRTWTALMNHVGIIFWNASFSKKYLPLDYKNGNIYIGNEERSYIRVINALFKNVATSSVPLSFTTDSSIRSYGLMDAHQIIGYIHRYTNYSVKEEAVMSFVMPKEGTLQWYDTNTGEIVSETQLLPGQQSVISPPFSVDIALKVSFSPQ